MDPKKALVKSDGIISHGMEFSKFSDWRRAWNTWIVPTIVRPIGWLHHVGHSVKWYSWQLVFFHGSWGFSVGNFCFAVFFVMLVGGGRTGQKNAEQNTPSLLKWNTNLWNHQHKRPWLPKQGPTRLLDFFKPLLNHVMLIEEHHDHNPALRLIWTHQSPIRNLSALG